MSPSSSRAIRASPPPCSMSLEDFASYEETRYLLKPPVNAARLLESIAELESGKGKQRTLDE